MTLEDLLELTKGYAGLGWAVAKQLDDVLNGKADDCNPNALRLLRTWLTAVDAKAGNDEELADEVGGCLDVVESALKRMEAGQ